MYDSSDDSVIEYCIVSPLVAWKEDGNRSIYFSFPQQLPFSKLSLSLSLLHVSAACNFPKQQEQ